MAEIVHSLRDKTLQLLDATNDFLGHAKPIVLISTSICGTLIVLRFRRLLRRSDEPLLKRFKAYCFSWIRCLPSVRAKIDEQMSKVVADLKHSIHENDNVDFIGRLALDPVLSKNIVSRMDTYQKMNKKFDYKKGRISGTVYTNMDSKHMDLLNEVFSKFAYSNPLHPDIFPAVRKMEAEVVRMMADLFNGDSNTCGTMTSGGTESIILACLSSRNYARTRRGIIDPIVVVPTTAHAAFDKACSLLNMRIRHIPVDKVTGRVNLKAMRSSIDSDTCLLVGSAPNFSSGTFDDIPSIAKLGVEFDIPVHVDACLGGFLIAFAESCPALAHLPSFDFRVDGITSLSCDTHKYGFAPKGTSVILYRSSELLHHQYFCVTEWPGGLYATPTLSGSRPGLNIALTWATLLHFGKKEYARRAHLITLKTALLADALAKIPGLFIVGKPDVSVVAFSSDEFNIHAVGDQLSQLGWNLNFLQNPNALHFCITYNQTADGILNTFLQDVKAACAELAAQPDRGKNSKTAAIYGMAAQLPDRGVIEEFAHLYIDAVYSKPSDEDVF